MITAELDRSRTRGATATGPQGPPLGPDRRRSGRRPILARALEPGR